MDVSHLRLDRYLWPLAACLVALLAGGWLMLAPFALGYQGYGAGWVTQTSNQFWVGLGVVLVAIVALALFAFSLVSGLLDAGVIEPRPHAAWDQHTNAKTPTPPQMALAAPEEGGVRNDEFERAVMALAQSLAADLAERRHVDTGQQPYLQPTRGGQP
ncbi:MAG: hypothetical protein IVW57_13520 [Ktedonobacterales bacterium]|nr:hypothetical protein [Ktedonobacterales bacterium]